MVRAVKAIWKGASNTARGHQNKTDVENAQTWHQTGTHNQLLPPNEQKAYWSDRYDSNIKPRLDHFDAADDWLNRSKQSVGSYSHRGHKKKLYRSSWREQSDVHQGSCWAGLECKNPHERDNFSGLSILDHEPCAVIDVHRLGPKRCRGDDRIFAILIIKKRLEKILLSIRPLPGLGIG